MSISSIGASIPPVYVSNSAGAAQALSSEASAASESLRQEGDYVMSEWAKLIIIWTLLQSLYPDLPQFQSQGTGDGGHRDATPSTGSGPVAVSGSIKNGGMDASGATGLTYGANGMMAGGGASFSGLGSMGAGGMVSVSV